jgi:hypothetical protein
VLDEPMMDMGMIGRKDGSVGRYAPYNGKPCVQYRDAEKNGQDQKR